MCHFEGNWKGKVIYLTLALYIRLFIIKCSIGEDIFYIRELLSNMIWGIDRKGFFCSDTYWLPNIYPDVVFKANFQEIVLL